MSGPHHPAYFIGHCFPAGDEPEYGTLRIAWSIDDWETILRVEGRPEKVRPLLVRKLLRVYTGEEPTQEQVRRFIDAQRNSWARVTPADLEEFCGQRELGLHEAEPDPLDQEAPS